MRHRLANRRAHETIAIVHEDTITGTMQRFKVGLGRPVVCDGSCGASPRLGHISEIFVSAQRPNSAIDVLVSDGAILMSLLLQHGCPIETIHHAMKRNPDGSPSSPLGRAAALIAESTSQGE